MRLNNKAQFDNHEVTADGVMVEVTRAFGDTSEMLVVCSDEQIRRLLVEFGTAYSNIEEDNRLELLFLLSKKIVTQDDALRVAAFFTKEFGASENDDILLHLCEGLVDYTALFEEDDEEDQTTCDSCGNEFDSVGRCSCATSYDFDEDHQEESPVIKSKKTSEVLATNYTNGVNDLRDDVVLSMVPHIMSVEGADIHVHTAEQVRLWLQQASERDLLNMLHHIQNPDQPLRGPSVTQQNPNLFSKKHMVLLEILNELHPQDPETGEAERDDEADDENFAFRN